MHPSIFRKKLATVVADLDNQLRSVENMAAYAAVKSLTVRVHPTRIVNPDNERQNLIRHSVSAQVRMDVLLQTTTPID